jgi:outer membrane protein insertion porin family
MSAAARRVRGDVARRARALAILVVALVAVVAVPAAQAFEPFVVRDIRVEGVQRTEAGTVFSYLPIKVGDRITDEKAAEAVKALYATGFFRDVRLEVQDSVLVVSVLERPTISRIDIVGNKEFDTDTLKKALKDIGIAEARIFDRSALDRAEQEMKRQYITRGRYAAKVTTTVTPQERNRVAVNFTVDEGDVAKIARINIVGNKAFTERELLDKMTLTTPGWTTWYTKNDQYSKQKLQADLESVRSFYQNQGYLEFDVESTQVSITPDKEDIYITVNIVEGGRYTVSDVRLAGEMMVPESELRSLLLIRPGDVFSRERLQVSTKNMSDRLGAEGFAFANVNAVPEVDREKLQASFTFYIDSGRRVYVRKINISGNVKTRDEVIRREMRQLEAAWYDGTRIERSKVRIRRLGYFEDVNIETPPVQGTPDEADVDVTVTEKSTGQLLAGIGYSSADGVVLNASISQQNIFGSGNALNLSVNTSKVNRTISMAYTDPYWTVDGVSRTIEIYQRNIDTASLDVTSYTSSTFGGAIGFGIPITETDAINVGFRAERTSIEFPTGYCVINDIQPIPPSYCLFVDSVGSPFNSFILSSGWSRDTRDDIIYPTRGRLQSLGVEVGLPFGDVPYYKANYLQQWFTPLPYLSDFTLMLRADVGYADGYSGKPLPFFKAFYAGGVGSVRGYQTASIGPKDIYGNSTGGKLKIIGNAELFYPILKGDKSVRASIFLDAGQIKGIPLATSSLSTSLEPGYQSFRYSAGVGLAWNSPIGPLKFSYGYPLNDQPLDKIQHFQFQVGSVF